ncbi:MAG: amino acid ABC transporter permease [Chloroflexota bacterium]|nr:amino acid ABC transporter permease [Chloroflexota bacterium]
MFVNTSPLDEARPNPQKRNLLIRRIARYPWWIIMAALLVVLFIWTVSGDETYQEAWAQIVQGIWTTIWVAVVAYGISVLLGLLIALLRRSRNVVVYQTATLYVEIIRGIPTLVLVYYIVLALTPQLVGLVNQLGVWMLANNVLPSLGQSFTELMTRDISTTARAIAGLAISYSAFLSEIFRAGLDSIDRGQYEAGYTMGMTRWQVMRHIVLPQAFRIALPALGNDFIALMKETSLLSVVGVQEITRQGATYAAANFTFFPTYNLVAVTYLVLTLSLSLVVKWVETRITRDRQAV